MSSSSSWVDFKAVKAAVSFSQVLSHYGVNWLRKQGDEQRGKCPFQGCGSEDGFHINSGKGAFQCFSCKKRGNILDFSAAMEGCTVRDAAVKLAGWFPVGEGGSGSKNEKAKQIEASPAPTLESGGVELVNKPLTFQLKGVDPGYPYVASRGVSREVAERFGVGFFPGKGSMTGRVVIPIHNEAGELLAYAGRSVDGSEPKYKLPAGFHKSQVVFNLHRALQVERSAGRDEVVVVEGFFDCMKVWQAGFPCVALMGCSLSPRQAVLIAAHFSCVTVFPDHDQAGMDMMVQTVNRLMHVCYTMVKLPPEGKQPDELEVEQIERLMAERECRPTLDSLKNLTPEGKLRLQVVK